MKRCLLMLFLAGCAAPPRHPVPPPAMPVRKALAVQHAPYHVSDQPYVYLPDDWPARTLRIWNTNDGYVHVAWKAEPGLWAQRYLPGWGWLWCNRMATGSTTNGWCVYHGCPVFGHGFFRLWSETNSNFTNAMTISVELLQKP